MVAEALLEKCESEVPKIKLLERAFFLVKVRVNEQDIKSKIAPTKSR